MEMYKITGAARRNKKAFIVFVIIWIIMAAFLIPAITAGYRTAANFKNLTAGLETFVRAIKNPIAGFTEVSRLEIWGKYFSTLGVATIIYSIFFIVGFVKAAPKNEYTDIEHGSSDWSKNGEQYTILNRNKGIVLAEKNYLPVDKRGNVNVLVVGRIRFW